jgi:hypothetical protein
MFGRPLSGARLRRRLIGWVLSSAVLTAGLTGSARSAKADPAEMAVNCVGRCISFLDAGTYRLIIDGTESIRAGAINKVIDEPGDYLIEGPARSRRGLGLLLGAIGVPMALVGTGILIGSEGLSSHLSAQQERWFWVGTGALAGGLTLMPIGFSMMSAKPEVSLLAPIAERAPRRAEPLSRVAARPRAPAYVEHSAVPPGYQASEEPRWGLLTSGALVLSSSYGIAAAIAAGNLVGSSNHGYLAKAFIPVIGPILISRSTTGEESTSWTVYGTIPQLAGAVLLFAGALTPKATLVRAPLRANVVPWATPNAGGLSLSGAF